MSAETATVIRTAPLALWRIAEAFLQTLCALFGAPDEIAQRHSYVHKHYTLMLSWLRAGEAMMRRLLAIEAAAYAKPNTRPLLRPARRRARRAVEFWPDKPDDWRVSFRCFLSRRRPRRRSAGGPRREQRFHDAWPAALRLEALIRAFNDPQRYARRIANRLHANVARLAELLFAPPEFDHCIDRSAEFTDAARDAWRQPDSS
ncbi:MAG: hypothetical protein AB7H66_16045 [Hyphomonadaceae bacterium]